ncbi:MAG: ribosome biogenesis GTP-binding protein YihA/YsxC [bacterium]
MTTSNQTKISSAVFMRGIRGTNSILYDGVPQIAFIGRSNVGKSSIINALTNRKDLVKVSNKPGKTREINFFKINNRLYFVDLPGYGYAKVDPDEKESLMKLILWYLVYSEVKPLKVILILDVKAGFTEFDREMVRALRENNHAYLIVANKTDKLSQKELAVQLQKIREESNEEDIILCSTVARGGIGELQKQIFN